MKRSILAIAALLLACLCGCGNTSVANTTGDMHTEQSYDLYALREFFLPRHMDGVVGFGESTGLSQEEKTERILNYNEMNQTFPVTQLEQVNPGCQYALYPVDQGGSYYVFLCYYQDMELKEETPQTTDYLYVFYTAYIGPGGYSRLDPTEIVPGTTTLAEIRQTDPYVEHVALSRGTFTCSLLDATTVLQIQYSYDKNNTDSNKSVYDLMLVTEVEVRKIEDSVSIMSEIFK